MEVYLASPTVGLLLAAIVVAFFSLFFCFFRHCLTRATRLRAKEGHQPLWRLRVRHPETESIQPAGAPAVSPFVDGDFFFFSLPATGSAVDNRVEANRNISLDCSVSVRQWRTFYAPWSDISKSELWYSIYRSGGFVRFSLFFFFLFFFGKAEESSLRQRRLSAPDHIRRKSTVNGFSGGRTKRWPLLFRNLTTATAAAATTKKTESARRVVPQRRRCPRWWSRKKNVSTWWTVTVLHHRPCSLGTGFHCFFSFKLAEVVFFFSPSGAVTSLSSLKAEKISTPWAVTDLRHRP